MIPCFDVTASPETCTVAPAAAVPALTDSDAGTEHPDHEAVAGMNAPGAAGWVSVMVQRVRRAPSSRQPSRRAPLALATSAPASSVMASAARRRSSHSHAIASERTTAAAPAHTRCESPSHSPVAYAATAWKRRGMLEVGRWLLVAGLT